MPAVQEQVLPVYAEMTPLGNMSGAYVPFEAIEPTRLTIGRAVVQLEQQAEGDPKALKRAYLTGTLDMTPDERDGLHQTFTSLAGKLTNAIDGKEPGRYVDVRLDGLEASGLLEGMRMGFAVHRSGQSLAGLFRDSGERYPRLGALLTILRPEAPQIWNGLIRELVAADETNHVSVLPRGPYKAQTDALWNELGDRRLRVQMARGLK